MIERRVRYAFTGETDIPHSQYEKIVANIVGKFVLLSGISILKVKIS